MSEIKKVCVAKKGRNKNGSYFDGVFLKSLTEKGNAAEKGIKCRFGHPSLFSNNLGLYVGRFKNFEFDGKKVTASLHLDETTKKTKVQNSDISTHDYIMDMAERNPDMFGCSIVVDMDLLNQVVDGSDERVAIFKELHGIDIVDEPAATDAFFSNQNQNQSINQLTSKMKILNTIKKMLSSVQFNLDISGAGGEMYVVETEMETVNVGDVIKKADGARVPDGEIVDVDGRTLTIKDSKIEAIKEKEEETPTEPSAEIAAIEAKFSARFEAQESAMLALAEHSASQAKELAQFKRLTNTKIEDFSTKPSETSNHRNGSGSSIGDRILNNLNKK